MTTKANVDNKKGNKTKVTDIIKETILKRFEATINNDTDFKWIKSWKGDCVARNFVSNKAYRGINLTLLLDTGNYMTFKQIQDKGGKLRKGSKGQPVVFYKMVQVKETNDNDDKEIKEIPLLRYSTVFHESDIENIEFPSQEYNIDIHEVNSKAEELITNFKKHFNINIIESNSNKAYFTIGTKDIKLPHRKLFHNNYKYYSTLFHEMIHSTGEELGRDMSDKDDSYSKEELVAEIGANMLLAYTGITDIECEKNSEAYVKGWYKRIKELKGNELLNAIKQAEKAANFILNIDNMD